MGVIMADNNKAEEEFESWYRSEYDNGYDEEDEEINGLKPCYLAGFEAGQKSLYDKTHMNPSESIKQSTAKAIFAELENGVMIGWHNQAYKDLKAKYTPSPASDKTLSKGFDKKD
jgi:hypothetical protein